VPASPGGHSGDLNAGIRWDTRITNTPWTTQDTMGTRGKPGIGPADVLPWRNPAAICDSGSGWHGETATGRGFDNLRRVMAQQARAARPENAGRLLFPYEPVSLLGTGIPSIIEPSSAEWPLVQVARG
jgi:hypothetical protein